MCPSVVLCSVLQDVGYDVTELVEFLAFQYIVTAVKDLQVTHQRRLTDGSFETGGGS